MAIFKIKRFTTVATLANLNGVTLYQVEKELQYKLQLQLRLLVPTGKLITTSLPARAMTPFLPQGTSYQKELLSQLKKAEQLTNKEEKQLKDFNKNGIEKSFTTLDNNSSLLEDSLIGAGSGIVGYGLKSGHDIYLSNKARIKALKCLNKMQELMELRPNNVSALEIKLSPEYRKLLEEFLKNHYISDNKGIYKKYFKLKTTPGKIIKKASVLAGLGALGGIAYNKLKKSNQDPKNNKNSLTAKEIMKGTASGAGLGMLSGVGLGVGSEVLANITKDKTPRLIELSPIKNHDSSLKLKKGRLAILGGSVLVPAIAGGIRKYINIKKKNKDDN